MFYHEVFEGRLDKNNVMRSWSPSRKEFVCGFNFVKIGFGYFHDGYFIKFWRYPKFLLPGSYPWHWTRALKVWASFFNFPC